MTSRLTIAGGIERSAIELFKSGDGGRSARWSRRKSAIGRWPKAAVGGVGIMLAIHLVAWRVVPHPSPPEPLRRKVLTLTSHGRPWVVAAGDSRIQTGLIPVVLADGLGVERGGVVNVALPVCEIAGVLSVFRERRDRFPGHPLVLLGVSLFSVNDGAREPTFLSDEVLWSLPFVDRARLGGVVRAVNSLFLPERSIVDRWKRERWGRFIDDVVAGKSAVETPAAFDLGFLELKRREGAAYSAFSDEAVRRQVVDVERYWVGKPKLDGVRWELLERDLKSLQSLGAGVVVINGPLHPRLLRELSGKAGGSALEAFDERLTSLTGRIGVEVLRYDATVFDSVQPDAVFHDLTHLNRRGATLFSTRVAGDLRRLMDAGLLRAPQ